MIYSMTGYGTGIVRREGIAAAVEIRTINHRFLDLHVRLGREYSFLEQEVSQIVRSLLRRGRVDMTVTIQAETPGQFQLNVEAAKEYAAAAVRLRDELGLSEEIDLKTLLALPGVLQNREAAVFEETAIDPNLTDAVMEAVRRALESVLRMRIKEGGILETAMRKYLESIAEKNRSIGALSEKATAEYRQKLEDRLSRLLPQSSAVDPQRLAQEVALLAEKADISEEIARMESHLEQFTGLLESGAESGKKMDFLLQEMHREVNTMLSKTGDFEITRLGIAIKADVEKLREQVQNVE